MSDTQGNIHMFNTAVLGGLLKIKNCFDILNIILIAS